ncbi:hypothetical protein ABH931_006046 [Streptacidiphilus sp. MAP12-33]|uniref:hypothetical protein n=1 Tax=Streptacidiphilus sp. MAP12-33 TaxID=3156266 RepID=UPI0035132215
MGHSGDTTQTGATGATGAEARDPFAPPPAGAPDRPWEPRSPISRAGLESGGPGEGHPHDARPGAGVDPGSATGTGAPRPAGGSPDGGSSDGSDGPGSSGSPDDPGTQGTPGVPGSRGRAQVPPPHPWSPGYQGQQPPTPRFPYPPPGPRYDPTDPVFRRSRLALLCGMWGFFFMVLGVPYVTLLLGALALYWGISALRGDVRKAPAATAGATPPGVQPMPARPGHYTPAYSPAPARPHVPAALGGVIAGAVSLALVAVVFGVQLYYKSYYDCQANALTKAGYDACATSVSPRPPAWLTQLNGS